MKPRPTNAKLVTRMIATTSVLIGCGSDAVDITRTNEVGAVRQALEQAQSARAEEVAAYLQEHYFTRFTVLATTQGPNGETVDWVDPHELDPDFDKRVPPPHEDTPASTVDTRQAARDAGILDLSSDYDFRDRWEQANRSAPAGTVPIMRPNFSAYIEPTFDEDAIVADSVEEFVAGQAQPQPANVIKLYAGKAQGGSTSTMSGLNGYIQYVRFLEVPANGFSLAQNAALCFGSDLGPNKTTLEAIEMGLIVFPARYGDSSLHLFTFFRTAGSAVGNLTGGWDTDFAGFVPCLNNCTETGGPAAFPPGAIIADPGAGGSGRRLRTVLSSGAWWVKDEVDTGFTWLGFYPIGTGAGKINFDLINSGACQAHWYGEAFDPTPTTWSNENLGNGILGSVTGSLSFHTLFTEVPSSQAPFSGNNVFTNDLDCYDTNAGTVTSTNSFFRYGGPGGNVAACP